MQIERHPLLPQTELIKYCADNGIHVTAYSPLGNNIQGERKIVDYPEGTRIFPVNEAFKRLADQTLLLFVFYPLRIIVKAIAERLSADPAQVLIAWSRRGGVSLVPKS